MRRVGARAAVLLLGRPGAGRMRRDREADALDEQRRLGLRQPAGLPHRRPRPRETRHRGGPGRGGTAVPHGPGSRRHGLLPDLCRNGADQRRRALPVLDGRGGARLHQDRQGHPAQSGRRRAVSCWARRAAPAPSRCRSASRSDTTATARRWRRNSTRCRRRSAPARMRRTSRSSRSRSRFPSFRPMPMTITRSWSASTPAPRRPPPPAAAAKARRRAHGKAVRRRRRTPGLRPGRAALGEARADDVRLRAKFPCTPSTPALYALHRPRPPRPTSTARRSSVAQRPGCWGIVQR